MKHFANMISLRVLLVFTTIFNLVTLVHSQDNFQVTYNDVGEDDYSLVLEWDHNPVLSLVLQSGVKNPGNYDGTHDSTNKLAGVCNTDTDTKAPTDGLVYWVPRFYPKSVPEEVTKKTGIHFASVDWQPCGHKDVVICHAESHYDFHLYYKPLSELKDEVGCSAPSPTCTLPTKSGSTWKNDFQPSDDATNTNQPEFVKDSKYFRLMKDNIPIQFVGQSAGQSDPKVSKTPGFCVDPTSGMPESGMHYGDKTETLAEWKHPVTIMGSYDCQLTFFEPMFSWKWVRGGISSTQTSWPVWESGEITYNEKTYEPLPTSWKVEVSPSCKYTPGGKDCHIKVTIFGKRCKGENGCGRPPRRCSQQKNCLTDTMVGTELDTGTTYPNVAMRGSSSSDTSASGGAASSIGNVIANIAGGDKMPGTSYNHNGEPLKPFDFQVTSQVEQDQMEKYPYVLSGSQVLEMRMFGLDSAPDDLLTDESLLNALGSPLQLSVAEYLHVSVNSVSIKGVSKVQSTLRILRESGVPAGHGRVLQSAEIAKHIVVKIKIDYEIGFQSQTLANYGSSNLRMNAMSTSILKERMNTNLYEWFHQESVTRPSGYRSLFGAHSDKVVTISVTNIEASSETNYPVVRRGATYTEGDTTASPAVRRQTMMASSILLVVSSLFWVGGLM